MANRRGRSTSPVKSNRPYSFSDAAEDDSIINTKQIEAFGRTVHATASQLIASNFNSTTDHAPPDAYRKALSSVHKTLRRPGIQRSVFSFAKANPRELIRSNFNTSEIEHRALSYVPDELLRNVPATSSPFSLFEGFRATLPDDETLADKIRRQRQGKSGSKDVKMLTEADEVTGPPQMVKLKREKQRFEHRLEMMGVRKGMCAAEIREIDSKIENLNTMRQVLMERLADLEDEEHELDQQTVGLAEKIDVMQEELDDEAALASQPPVIVEPIEEKVPEQDPEEDAMQASFMSESVYEKLPKAKDTTKPKRRKPFRRLSSMPILHQNMKPGARIRELQAHNDVITALDFDAPYGTMVTAALDDTVRVWDLNAGRCMGLLEGHLSSVRCLQVEENLVATGSMDASIRLWDLSQADYNPLATPATSKSSVTDEETDDVYTPATEEPPLAQSEYHSNAMEDCHLFTLSAHVAEITALHFREKTLVSGSADKTLRQWDLEKGRCIQTLDVLWAAAQASTISPSNNTAPGGNKDNDWWRPTGGRVPDAEADFIGALQVFETALACGTADGMVRLWDLRGANVVRSLIGHTGPITSLQFDDHFLVTSSRDRSIRVWDLRTGGIRDVFAYDNPITSMMFDARRIASAAGESVVKVYDKTDGRHWDCGAGADEVDESSSPYSIVERVRIKDGYLIEGRRDGMVGVWSC
ncbi:hypothetical protein AMS68_005189 [Peltaster fructicola]|uniref:Mitochondrial division protein 1 n=1 Tax=Peltaster fructicola TaxID=286661 RepID=A0A6H0XY26_9PEZI|nr:hypothetical protein AMS68_005189 [Peltaster fructicola]